MNRSKRRYMIPLQSESKSHFLKVTHSHSVSKKAKNYLVNHFTMIMNKGLLMNCLNPKALEFCLSINQLPGFWI